MRKTKNYADYFFDIIDHVKKNDKLEDGRIVKTIGLGDTYYSHYDEFCYNGITIQNLKDTFLGGYIDPDNHKYHRYKLDVDRPNNEKRKGNILILSRVGEHLFDFYHQVMDIYKQNIAEHVYFILPNMKVLTEKIYNNIKKCEVDGCLDFEFERNQIELLSTTDGDITDLHRLYTAPGIMEDIFKPIQKYLKSLSVKTCEYDINGYEHFICKISFIDEDIKVSGIKYNTENEIDYDIHKLIDHQGIYVYSNQTHIFKKIIIEDYDFTELVNSQSDIVILNRELSKHNDVEYFLYRLSSYLKPKTKIIVVDSNTLLQIKSLEKYGSDSIYSYWYYNKWIFGPSHQQMLDSEYNYVDDNLFNQNIMTPEITDLYMTQEKLYQKSKLNNDDLDMIDMFIYDENIFVKAYERI